MTMDLDNSYAKLPEGFHARVEPATSAAPSLLAWNTDLAVELGLDSLAGDEVELARIFSGASRPAGIRPIALAYAGHQFGHFVPQLGDGRAALLGEVVTDAGRRFDIQLKGSGRTPYSRGGDGKSWLGPVLREYILSEAMHHLGIPTTRALAAVATGESVFRETALPGAVFTRVASSHLRVGTFEYFAARGNTDALRTLTDYAIARHYPEARSEAQPTVAFFRRVAERQAELVAGWMAVGFIHGVMNTDNTAISGETLDYGPAAFLDEFQFRKVFSSIDHQGRYAYANQMPIAQWNLARLAETLLLLCDARSEFETILSEFSVHYESCYLERMRPKLGLIQEDDGDADLIGDWLKYLQDHALDYTLSFRELATRIDTSDPARFGEFEGRWRQRVVDQAAELTEVRARMNSVNPVFIPRNHRIEQAIQEAVAGNLTTFRDLNKVLAHPFVEQPEYAQYAAAPIPSQRVTQTFCGT
ncbi:MAG: YdiU family protein [Gammaproteobacteria bacterium]|nr:YdiU family protein [Gammaproteobacteria bacterium]